MIMYLAEDSFSSFSEPTFRPFHLVEDRRIVRRLS